MHGWGGVGWAIGYLCVLAWIAEVHLEPGIWAGWTAGVVEGSDERNPMGQRSIRWVEDPGYRYLGGMDSWGTGWVRCMFGVDSWGQRYALVGQLGYRGCRRGQVKGWGGGPGCLQGLGGAS